MLLFHSQLFLKNSDYLEPEEFIKLQLNHLNREDYKCDSKTGSIIDNRSKMWTKVPLAGLINPLVELRKEFKNTIRTSKNKNEIESAKSQDANIKLIINSIYGVISSQHYEFCNTILANNITARARLNVWMASRPLRGLQCITDGFLYQPEFVLKLKEKQKLPGLHSLSKLSSYTEKQINKKQIKVKFTTLGNEKWDPLFNGEKDLSEYPDLNLLATNAINNFWRPYNLNIQYKIEHKIEKTAKEVIYFFKSHYVLKLLNNDLLYKIRGLNISQLITTPVIFKIIDKILHPEKDIIITDFSHEETRITRISDTVLRNLSAGIEIVDKKNFHWYSSEQPIQTLDEWKKMKKLDIDKREIFLNTPDIIQRIEEEKNSF